MSMISSSSRSRLVTLTRARSSVRPMTRSRTTWASSNNGGKVGVMGTTAVTDMASAHPYHYQHRHHPSISSRTVNNPRLYHSSPTTFQQQQQQQQQESSPSSTEPPPKPFQKILIANRGEITRRIIRTCNKLSIPTVAIHSTVDSKEPHVLEATESVCVGPANSSESYLNIGNILDAVERTGATGVHPGYGFLSENAEFAKSLEDFRHADTDVTTSTTAANDDETGKRENETEKSTRKRSEGCTFIGPSVSSILAMGDKITSKKIAQEAGVNVIPGNDKFLTSPSEAVAIANEIGYPVMLKATSGGGGKGMRICYSDDQVREGYELSKAEAKSFFDDDRVFLEKYVERPHHIEFQLLAGRKKCKVKTKTRLPPVMNPMPIVRKGNSIRTIEEEEGELEILVFVERECSIQRRNQKVIEESPSTLLTKETRAEMVRQVRSLVRRVDYSSAGTVEFLVDEEQNFYFLEMNTRLQVEHPVTEMVSEGDVDLVRGMVEVAAGWGIPQEYLDLVGDTEGMTEEEKDGLVVPFKGHAIEARIYAEDPVRGFLPSIGPLVQYAEPPNSNEATDNDGTDPQIRVDSGVVPGSNISQYYDPMISKLIAFSPIDRLGAIHSLTGALDQYIIHGVGHNTSFISDLLRNKEFIDGSTPTNFIDMHYPDGFSGVKLTPEEQRELAGIVATVSAWRTLFLQKPGLPLSHSCSGVNTMLDGGEEVIVCLGGMFGDAYSVQVSNSNEKSAALRVFPISKEGVNDDSEVHNVVLGSIEYDPLNPIVTVEVNGKVKYMQIQNSNSSGIFGIKLSGADMDVMIMSPGEYALSSHMLEPKIADTSNFLLSPMPGTLISYAVDDGDHVITGQEICIVEAMKMQNVLRSSRSGIIRKKASTGSSLMTDDVIVEFVESEDGEEDSVAQE